MSSEHFTVPPGAGFSVSVGTGTSGSASVETYRVPAEEEPFERQAVVAAERGDRLAFSIAAYRLGGLPAARSLVRSRGIVRMADRATQWAPVAVAADSEQRDTDDEGGDGTTMVGHFAVFDEWTEIDSYFEGHFLERIAPRAFRKTFRENRGDIKPLFQHGADPMIGDKPLGTVDELREDDTGAYYEVPLLDAKYVREEILPGLREGVYGASFRFRTIRDEFNEEPGVSDHNPAGLPERTLKELRVYEFGPVTFPAYPSATAGVRSVETHDDDTTPPQGSAGTTSSAGDHPTLGRRGMPTYSLNRKEAPRWRLP